MCFMIRYEEDVYINNHTSVFGSWWHNGVWGYACCHQTVKNSYCTGQVGKKIAAEEQIINQIPLSNDKMEEEKND